MRHFEVRILSKDIAVSEKYSDYIFNRLQEFEGVTVRPFSSLSVWLGATFNIYEASVKDIDDSQVIQFAEDLRRFSLREEDTIIIESDERLLARSLSGIVDLLRIGKISSLKIGILPTNDFLEKRLQQLKAASSTEGLIWASGSEQDFRDWIGIHLPKTAPFVFLSNSGNIGVEWRTALGKFNDAIALEFCGNKNVTYSFVLERAQDNYIATCRGNDQQDFVARLIKCQGLDKLLYE
jgi:hypothetical protein